MRVNPVTSADRAKVRRRRPVKGEAEREHRTSAFAAHLPVPLQPALEQDQAEFAARYRPNSVFLAHLLATRDLELPTVQGGHAEAQRGTGSYRATAALPRRRQAGHLLRTER